MATRKKLIPALYADCQQTELKMANDSPIMDSTPLKYNVNNFDVNDDKFCCHYRDVYRYAPVIETDADDNILSDDTSFSKYSFNHLSKKDIYKNIFKYFILLKETKENISRKLKSI